MRFIDVLTIEVVKSLAVPINILKLQVTVLPVMPMVREKSRGREGIG